MQRRDLFTVMVATRPALLIAAVIFAGLTGAAQADPFGLIVFNSYKLENRPELVFPGKRIHISPYPMSKRAASVWHSDLCWRTCTGETAWRFDACKNAHGLEACRFPHDADNRACLRACRTRGGPLLNLAN
jgi:hypothetical protein